MDVLWGLCIPLGHSHFCQGNWPQTNQWRKKNLKILLRTSSLFQTYFGAGHRLLRVLALLQGQRMVGSWGLRCNSWYLKASKYASYLVLMRAFGKLERKISLPLLLCEYGQESFTAKSKNDICYPKHRHQQVEPTHATGPAIATCFNVLNVEFLHGLAEDADCKC